jgi:tetratricopeptide (TPR) repeat protein
LAYHLNSLINQDSPSGLYLRRANAFAGLEQWELAKKDLSRYRELTPGSADSRFYLALLCLANGDLTEFHSVCEAMISQYATSETPDHANALVWLLALTPERPNDLRLMTERIEFACERANESNERYLTLNTLGLTYYRGQRYQEALRAIRESIRLQDGVGSEPDWIVLSMIHSKLGNRKDAQHWLTQANQSLNNAVGLGNPVSKKHSRNWINRFQLILLLTEAQQLIKPVDDK